VTRRYLGRGKDKIKSQEVKSIVSHPLKLRRKVGLGQTIRDSSCAASFAKAGLRTAGVRAYDKARVAVAESGIQRDYEGHQRGNF